MKSQLLLKRTVILTVLLMVAGLPLRGQWITEQYPLKAGWNAVYLHLDASHLSLNELIGSDPDNPIEEVWMWVPPGPTLQFFDAVQTPSGGTTEWLRWDRYWAGASPLQRLAGNVACLVRVADGAPDFVWELTGKAMPPRKEWTSSGMNLIGFATPRVNPPTWGTFLGPVRSLHDFAEIYQYVGGALGSTNPRRLFSSMLRNTPLVRNHAYWVRSEEYNRYFGPFEVELQQPSGIHFGKTRGQYRMRLRSRIDEPVTVTAELVASLPAPAGEAAIAGIVPLLLRGEQDLADLSYGFSRFSETNGTWTLPAAGEPGSDIEVVVGIDRSAMGGQEGDLFAGVLRLRDSAGTILIDLRVTAEVGGRSGLWVGNAVISEVAHYLVDYQLGVEGEPEQNPDGSYVVTDVDQSFGAVPRPFPLRLIVHNSGSGNAQLLQRVYYGSAPGGNLILARSEGALDPEDIEEARRMSVAHLPWTEGNVAYSFNGPLSDGADIQVTVNVDYGELATNPFLHTYHPDHDNLDARFESELPRGVESYDIVREISLRVQAPGGDFASVTTGTGTISGIYEETMTLRGRVGDGPPNNRTFRSRGGFALNLVSEIATLAD